MIADHGEGGFSRLPQTVERFLAWLEDGPQGARCELVAGEVVAMAPERAAHARLNAEVWLALRDGIRSAGLPCEALPDGMTIKIDEHTAYEPDAVVHCGQRLADDALLVPEPVIVVEVLSPTTTTPAPSSPAISACRACAIICWSAPSGRR